MRRGNLDGVPTVLYITIVNILPISGIYFFSWSYSELMFVYLIENILLITLYSVLIAFAAREPRTTDFSPRAVPIPFVSDRSGWTRIVRWLPPINYWNIQFITWPLLFGLAFWQVVGTLFVDISDLNFTIEGGPDTPIGDYVTVLTTAASFEAIVVALLIFAMSCTLICREFFGQEQYEDFSAPGLAEIPIRIGLYWFITMIFVHIVVILSYPITFVFNLTNYAGFRVIAIFLTMKILVDWSLIKVQRGDKPEKVVYWFTFFWSGPESDKDPKA